MYSLMLSNKVKLDSIKSFCINQGITGYTINFWQHSAVYLDFKNQKDCQLVVDFLGDNDVVDFKTYRSKTFRHHGGLYVNTIVTFD